jgi:tape measure domain-containing protein
MPKVKGPSVETRLTANTTDFDAKMRGAWSNVRRLDGAVTGLGAVMGGLAVAQFAKSVFDAGVRAERSAKSYEAITGNIRDAGVEMDFVRKEADRLGLVFYDTADAYKSLFAASRGTAMEGESTRKIFIALTEAGTALGLSNDEINGSLYAVTQMMSKGKVQAEELRGQLGERLPGAFQMAAQAMGVTTAELDKMLADGQVMADDLLPRLADLMHDKYVDGAEAMADGQVAAVNRMQTAWDDFKTSLSSSSAAVGGVNAITFALEGATEGVEGLGRMYETTAAMWRGELGFGEWLTMSHDEAEHWLETVTEVEKLENRIADLRLRQRGQMYKDEKEATEAQIKELEAELATAKDEQRLNAMKAIKGDTLGYGDMSWTNDKPDATEEQKASAEELERISDRMTNAINKNALNRYDYQREKLRLEVEDYRAKGVSVAEIERYTASELKRISNEEAEAKSKEAKAVEQRAAKELAQINDELTDTYKQNTLSRFDYERQKVQENVDHARELGASYADIERYQSSELKRIREEETEYLKDEAEKAHKQTDKWKDKFGELGDVGEDAFGQIGSSMTSSFKTGDHLLDGLIDKLLDVAVMNPFENFITSGSKSGKGLFGLGFLGFADGGVSNSPGLAMVSEGRYKEEAHVPLPDGRTIPVTLDGATGSVAYFDIDVTVDGSSGNQEQDERYADTIAKTLEKRLDAAINAKIRQAQRPGGIMNGGPKI